MGTHNPWQTQWPGSNYRCQIKIGSPQCGASDKAESYHVLGWAARQCGCVQLLHAATARSSQPISPCFSPCNPETSPTPASQFHPTHPCYQPKGTQMPSIKKKKVCNEILEEGRSSDEEYLHENKKAESAAVVGKLTCNIKCVSLVHLPDLETNSS